MAQNDIEISKVNNNSSSLIVSLDSNRKLNLEDDPLQHFTYALRSPETKRQYPKRLKVFMDFVKIDGDLKQQVKTLKEKNTKRTRMVRYL